MGGEKPQDETHVITTTITAPESSSNMQETAPHPPTEAAGGGHDHHNSTTETLSRRRRTAIPALGKTTVFASRHDPRFCYGLYVPPDFFASTSNTAPELIVVVHDSGRGFLEYRDALAEFGRWNNCIILAPLFPANVLGDDNRDGYKYILEGSIRYDLTLLAIVDEVRTIYHLPSPRFALFGFSGGGHFTHRFFLLHPDRLWAVSIGAPGSTRNGTGGSARGISQARFGGTGAGGVDVGAMARVPVQMVVGKADLETWEITHHKGDRYWMPGANDAGKTRPERLMSLRRSFEDAGVEVRFDMVSGMAHDGLRALETAKDFIAEVLRTKRS
ncbi:hypothetical protein N0V93_006237 [Gnomoniopsis smithogilvyi]|uniref:Uncharacterized protein n=1 Tax=Gnomoniopsis smithogilvyi TaxID=1191159 RepID=A0A9W9CVI1_9PEZI|nr:hypothetical protein N0V93_006237 [Gnomoniopsis smithogilvyi]